MLLRKRCDYIGNENDNKREKKRKKKRKRWKYGEWVRKDAPDSWQRTSRQMTW